jgi:UMF1 family MFS transporter
MQLLHASDKKLHRAWAMYDWANSAYNLVITSTIFPAYYESITGDGNDATNDYVTLFGFRFLNTALYNYSLAVAFIIVAILSPLLSSIADSKGNKKSFMRFFATMGSLACMGLFFFDKDNLWLGLLMSIIACVGFWGSLVFYNSYLPEIANYDERDKVSATGFVYGYVGSVLLQIICFVFVLKNDLFHITKGFASQLSFLLVGVWWIGFTQIPLKKLPKGTPSEDNPYRGFHQGYFELHKVWLQLKNIKKLKRFLFSFFFYNMGVQTVMLAATLYGKSELGIPTENLIVAILIIQIIAILGAWFISKLSHIIGNIPTLMACVLVWIFICIGGYYLPAKDVNAFYVLASVVGFVMGGIQSLSRSTYSKLMPVTHDTTSFFSFFDVTEKIAIVIGMFSFGTIQEITKSQRTSVLALVIFFLIGLMLLAITHKTKDETC